MIINWNPAYKFNQYEYVTGLGVMAVNGVLVSVTEVIPVKAIIVLEITRKAEIVLEITRKAEIVLEI